MQEESRISAIRNRLGGRFSVLFYSIILTLALRPFLESHFKIAFVTDVFFSAILLSGILAAAQKRSTLTVSLLIGVPALILEWLTYFSAFFVFEGLRNILFALFFSFALVVIASHVHRQKEVTSDVILGAASAYFLMAVSWASFFVLLEETQPGSFYMAAGPLEHFDDFLYFSLATLTTTGYGDITPVSSPARSLALLEAAIGQLYIAVTVARLVGIYTSQSLSKRDG